MTGRQSSLLIDESPLQVIPSLAVAIGLNEAIMLQQIHYWQRVSQHEKAGVRYVAMSAPELVDKFPFWSEKTIKRTLASLKEKHLLAVTKKSDNSWERANWYAVNYEGLNALGSASGQNDPMHQANLTPSIGPKRPDRSGQNDPITIEGKNNNKNRALISAFQLPDWITPEAWGGYEAMRLKVRKPMTDRARDLVVKKLHTLKAQGQDPIAVLEQSERNSWTDVYAIKAEAVNGHQPNWTDSDQAMLAKADELGLSTKGLTTYQLKAKINEALTRKPH